MRMERMNILFVYKNAVDNQRLIKFIEIFSANSLPVQIKPLILHPQSALRPVPLRNSGFEGLTRREIFEEIPID